MTSPQQPNQLQPQQPQSNQSQTPPSTTPQQQVSATSPQQPQEPVYGVPQSAAPVPPQYGAGAHYAWQSQGVSTTDGQVPGYCPPQMQSGVPAPVPAPGMGAVPELDPKQVQKWRWRWALRGVSAVLLVVTLVLGAMTAAETESMLYIMDPPIHAKHDNGVKESFHQKRLTREEYTQTMQQYLQWGWEQSPDWIAFCNKINRRALRRFKLDPQKDLENRYTGGYKWVCSWNPGGQYSQRGEVPRSVVMALMRNYTVDQYLTEKRNIIRDIKFLTGTSDTVATGIPVQAIDKPSHCFAMKKVSNGLIVLQLYDAQVKRTREQSCAVALDLLEVN